MTWGSAWLLLSLSIFPVGQPVVHFKASNIQTQKFATKKVVCLIYFTTNGSLKKKYAKNPMSFSLLDHVARYGLEDVAKNGHNENLQVIPSLHAY